MVIILPPAPPKKTFGQKLGAGVGRGLEIGGQMLKEHEQGKALLAEREHELNKIHLAEELRGQTAEKTQLAKFESQKKMFEELGLGEEFGGQGRQEKPKMETGRSDQNVNEQGEIEVGNVPLKTARLIPEDKIAKAALVNPAVADKMQKHNDNILAQQKHEENLSQKEIASARKETMSLRKEFVDKAKYAKDAIKNKGNQLKLIRKGNIDSPERVFFASLLPGALGNKLLSSDTQLYRAGLFEEFGVLKSMFPGQIRVKEIELLEDKLASLEKSDEAKEKILETGMEKLKIPIIKEKAAQRVEKEHPKATILEFEKLVDEYSHDELEKAYDEISKSYDKVYFDYAPEKNTLIDKEGNIYKDIPKNLLRQFYEEGDKEGLELRPL